jgi:catechol 2,3-dioxygenase-like lactoylglutathione lyase family enzyme
MFSHVLLGTNDLPKSRKFYDATMAALGYGPAFDAGHRFFFMSPTGAFGVTTPINGEPATISNGATLGFSVQSPEQADAWHAAGLAAGGTACEDPPGVRDGQMGKLYLAYLRDPDGNKLCAFLRM